MSLHGLGKVTIGVPDVTANIAYYTEFGLDHRGNGVFATEYGGDQLEIVHSARRRLVELTVAADDPDDVSSITSRLTALGVHVDAKEKSLMATEPATGLRVRVDVRPRIAFPVTPRTPYNAPGRIERTGRAPFTRREGRVRPRRLGHAVIGSANHEATIKFFTEGLGFKISDYVGEVAAFMRCSTDHHNVLVQASPVSFLHHTSWQVDDIDDVGRGAFDMLQNNPERHAWGLGRHYAGSNFFWYLRDPAGNFSEYYSDMDSIPEDEVWTPEVLHGAAAIYAWGPPPPPSFLQPEDLAALMTGAHSAGD